MKAICMEPLPVQESTSHPCRNTVGSFSPIFLDRVYEEHLVSHKTCRAKGYPDQMDFGAFLDFMLAWDNRSSMAGIQYLFPVLDLKGRGYLSQVCATMQKDWLRSCRMKGREYLSQV